jgi:hypothetical protein
MPLTAFQEMVAATVKRSLGPAADLLLQRVCGDMGVPLGALGPHHMPELSRRFYEATAGILEEHQRKFLSGTLAHFEKSKVGEKVPLAMARGQGGV